MPTQPHPAGSFGSVYLAEWNQTLVACKVLITQGASQEAAKGRDGLASMAAFHYPLDLPWLLISGADSIVRAELGLPEEVMHDLQAEAAVMSRMRHPK